jgi:hypothetical protein
MVVITNGSDRPIREVACKIEAIEADEKTRRQKPADVYGEILPMALGPGAQVEVFAQEHVHVPRDRLRRQRQPATAGQFPDPVAGCCTALSAGDLARNSTRGFPVSPRERTSGLGTGCRTSGRLYDHAWPGLRCRGCWVAWVMAGAPAGLRAVRGPRPRRR